jgi:hypothetical protein
MNGPRPDHAAQRRVRVVGVAPGHVAAVPDTEQPVLGHLEVAMSASVITC